MQKQTGCSEQAPARFRQALELCRKSDPGNTDPDVQELRAEILRRIGAVQRLSGRLDEVETCYAAAAIYSEYMSRGLVWLLPERAELLRAKAFASPESAQSAAAEFLAQASTLYEEIWVMAQRIRNISWYAHGLIGECELTLITC